jgi:predicted RNA-binding Zn ribbon-like protein
MALPSWIPAEETKPAPPHLLVVQAFVNTYEAERESDLLGEPDTAKDWLVRAGLLARDATLGPADLHRARQVREAIRALMVANAGGAGPTSEQRRLLADVAGLGSLRLTVGRDKEIGIRADAARPLDAALVDLLLAIRDAQRDGTWTRLKACGNDECRWAFYDRSHSSRGRWCDMAVCGNRLKNRALRARQR